MLDTQTKLNQQISDNYQIDIAKSDQLARDDGDALLVLKITDTAGNNFFCKEVQYHSLRPDFDKLFSDLATVQVHDFDMVLPIKSKKLNSYLIEVQNHHYLLFPWNDLQHFDPERISHATMLARIGEFHKQVRKFKWSGHDFKTFSSWISRGANLLKQQYGNDIPILKKLRR